MPDRDETLQTAGELMAAEPGGHRKEAELWALLERQVKAYTMGESSSVPVELAEELLASIQFCLEAAAAEFGQADTLEEMLEKGMECVRAQVARSDALLHAVKQTMLPVDNRSYHDTVQALGLFSRRYDVRFFAHQIPCDIDYQLGNPVAETLVGVRYIDAYLRHLLVENQFCRRFSPQRMTRLLHACCPDYKELLMNLYEPVFTNAVGLALLGKDVTGLDMDDSDRACLAQRFIGGDTLQVLQEGVQKLCGALDIRDAETRGYLGLSATVLAPRVEQGLSWGLGEVFLTLHDGVEELDPFVFEDGAPMEDAALRSLLAELGACRHASDKIAMIHRQVHALADLVEILDAVMDQIELPVLFAGLAPPVLMALVQHLAGQWDALEEYPPWGKALIKYAYEQT